MVIPNFRLIQFDFSECPLGVAGLLKLQSSNFKTISMNNLQPFQKYYAVIYLTLVYITIE